jgi:hypothetical protein
MVLDPAVPWYYLDTDLITSNNPLKDGSYPFHLATDPTDVIFWVKVAGTTYTLIDDYLGDPHPLRINGTFTPGAYTYNGNLTDIYGSSAPVSIKITFVAPLAVTALSLQKSPDKAIWSTVTGNLTGGYTVELDGVAASWTYLDVASLTANRTLADGSYAFTLVQEGLPGGWLTYWAVKGVAAGATGWQGQMWQIINGNAPIFYLKVSAEGGSYMLVDGLGRALSQPDDFLRVNGDYPPGTYGYTGSVSDTVGSSASVTAKMTFFVKPTGVEIAGVQAAAQADGVVLTWQTATEAQIVGFNVLRQVEGGEPVQANAELIFAEHAGANLGASYYYTDSGLPAGTYMYVLQIIRLDGTSETYDTTAVVTTSGGG